MTDLQHPPGARGRSVIYGGSHPPRQYVDARGDGDFNLDSWFEDITHRLVLSRDELEALHKQIGEALR